MYDETPQTIWDAEEQKGLLICLHDQRVMY